MLGKRTGHRTNSRKERRGRPCKTKEDETLFVSTTPPLGRTHHHTHLRYVRLGPCFRCFYTLCGCDVRESPSITVAQLPFHAAHGAGQHPSIVFLGVMTVRISAVIVLSLPWHGEQCPSIHFFNKSAATSSHSSFDGHVLSSADLPIYPVSTFTLSMLAQTTNNTVDCSAFMMSHRALEVDWMTDL